MGGGVGGVEGQLGIALPVWHNALASGLRGGFAGLTLFPNLIEIVNALLDLFEGPVDLGLQLSVGRHGQSCRGGQMG